MRTGTTIGQYEIGELLGRGGMGDVYRAVDTRLDRPVALKFLAAHYVADVEAKARFIREAKAASALDHPNICTIHDIGETEEGELFIVMALYEGQALDARMRSEAFTVERTIHLIRQLGLALKRAHEGGIVHRDVKPANVIVSADDALRLLDFGVAKLQAADGMTRTGASIGTAGYMSPEQATGEPVSAASDVWALGLITYEILAGAPPFKASHPVALVSQIVTAEPPPIGDVRPDTPAPVAEVVHRALAKAPGDRYADAGAFVDALDAATGGSAGHSAPTRSGATAQGGRYRRSLVLAGLAAVAIVAAVALWPRTATDTTAAVSAPSDVMAIFPFGVRGPAEFEYLSEGIPEIIGDLLDGAGSLRTIDPRAVAGRLAGVDGVLDAGQAAAVATELGAGRFVLGSIVALPGRMTLTARAYEVGGDPSGATPVTFDGDPDSLSLLVDRLATGILETSLTGANARIQRSAARTSANPAATRAFLQGEQFHRSGAFDSAAVAYNRALEADSTMALAHLMKSMNNAYTYETDDYVAAVKAWEYSGDLPERDRSLIRAFMNMQAGRLDEAEQEFLAHLKRWPDEVKALLYLGILYDRSNPRWARSVEQARPYYSSVLELEPGNVAALHRLARMDAGAGYYDSIPPRAAALERIAPDSEWWIDAETLSAFTLNQTARIEEMTESYAEQSLLARLYTAYNALRFAEDPLLAERLLELTATGANADSGLPDFFQLDDGLSIVIRRMSALNGGRFEEIRATLVDPDRPRTPTWVVWEAELLVSGVVPVAPSILESALEELRSVEPLERLRNPFEPLHDIFTVEVARLERDVAIAMLLGRLGRTDEAWALQRDIAQRGPYEGFESLGDDASGGLAADLTMLAGDPEQALEILRSLEYQLPMTANSLQITHASHARWLRAELEFEIGDREVARHLYDGFVDPFAPPDKIYMAPAYERLGQLHDAAGRPDEARRAYRRFVQLYAHADEDQQERVAEARRRLAELENS